MGNVFGAGAASSASFQSEIQWKVALRALLFGAVFVAVVSLVLTSEFFPGSQLALEVGDVSPADIHAPSKTTYVSPILTELERAKVEAAVKDVYDPPDARVRRQQVTRARQIWDYIGSVRHDVYAPPERKAASIEAIPDLTLPSAVISEVLSLSDEEIQSVANKTVSVLDQAMGREIRATQLNEAGRLVPTYIGPALSDEQADVVIALVRGLIKPNSFLNEEKSAEARQRARDEVKAVSNTLEEGQIILRQGDIVTALDLEILDAYGLRQTKTDWRDIVGTMGFVLVMASVIGLYVRRFEPGLWLDRDRMLLLLILPIAFILMAKLMVPGHVVLPYLFPLAALSMLMTVLLGPTLAIVVVVLLSLTVGFMANGFLELTVYVLLGGLVASLSLRRVEGFVAFFWASVYVILTNLAVVFAFRLLSHDYDTVGLLQLGGAAVGNGALAAGLTLAAFFVLGSVFGIATSIQLLELARPTHPLLRQLLLKAPGTYHHSLLVGNMAEQATEHIGADPLLARVGAYYHDIGKVSRPYFFTENQMDGVNVHERLDPRTSAQIILDHVRDGLELASKYRLPRIVSDFIPQHHGTGVVKYFYRRACEEGGGCEKVDEEDFRYPGPKPQSKEAAIVMLADACEATVRSARPGSAEDIRKLVHKRIEARLLDGQLDDSDLTLRDLKLIRDSFVSILQGVFHPRISYPKELEAGASSELAVSQESSPVAAQP